MADALVTLAAVAELRDGPSVASLAAGVVDRRVAFFSAALNSPSLAGYVRPYLEKLKQAEITQAERELRDRLSTSSP